jgi:hypothetical protein
MQYIIVPFGVPLAVGLIFYLLKRVDANLPPSVHDALSKYAAMGVTAAEQLHGTSPGAVKKAYAVDVLENALSHFNIKVDPVLTDAAIEAAVGAMKAAQPVPVPQPLVSAIPDAKPAQLV